MVTNDALSTKIFSNVLRVLCQDPWTKTKYTHTHTHTHTHVSVQFGSVQFTQLCLTLCNPMDCSTPGCPVYHQHLELTQPHVHQVGDAIQPSHPLSSPSPNFNLVQHQGLFFPSGGHSIGVSASASVLPMNIQDWLPLGLNGLISLQSKGLSRVFPNTTVQKPKASNSSALSFLYSPTLTCIHDYRKNHSFE